MGSDPSVYFPIFKFPLLSSLIECVLNALMSSHAHIYFRVYLWDSFYTQHSPGEFLYLASLPPDFPTANTAHSRK